MPEEENEYTLTLTLKSFDTRDFLRAAAAQLSVAVLACPEPDGENEQMPFDMMLLNGLSAFKVTHADGRTVMSANISQEEDTDG